MFGEVYHKLFKLVQEYEAHRKLENEHGVSAHWFAVSAAEIFKQSHELRDLRWKNKTLGKQVGKQGQRIYELRCRLSEARSFITVDASSYRATRDNLVAALQRNVKLKQEVRELQEKLANAEKFKSENINILDIHDGLPASAIDGLA